MKSIEIDIDVHRAIETGRLGFDESPNLILRRLLAIDARPRTVPAAERPRAARSSGAYSIVLADRPIEANSLKELLRRAILLGEKLQPGLIEELSRQATPRGRRIVARSIAALYPRSPQLAEFGGRLADGWFYDTNVGRSQVLSHLKLIATMLHLPNMPAINKRAERSSVTLEDLGLA